MECYLHVLHNFWLSHKHISLPLGLTNLPLLLLQNMAKFCDT